MEFNSAEVIDPGASVAPRIGPSRNPMPPIIAQPTEEIEVKFNASPMEIGFNSAYLMDVARQIEGEGCRISLSDPASPTIIQDLADPSSLYVLMPMRV